RDGGLVSVDIPAGDTAYFYAKCTVSEDPDPNDIKWLFDLDGDGTYESGATTAHDVRYATTSKTYSDPNVYDITACACIDNGKNDWSAPGSCEVTAVGVLKVVKDDPGDPNKSGPLYVGVGATVDLKAIPDPNTASFPSGEPTWEITSQPGGDPNGPGSLSSSGEYATFSTDPDDPNAPGDYVVEATCGTDSNSITIVVVGVDKIQINSGSGWDDVTGSTIYLLKGTKYTFKTTHSPLGNWPSGEPTWSGVASGTGETIDVTFSNSGAMTLTANCGNSSKEVTIEVIVPVVDEVSFAGNDHDIRSVSDPVWKRVSSPDDPASYTMDEPISTEVKFWHSNALSYVTSVEVDVEGTDSFTFNVDDANFLSWPSPEVENTSDGNIANSIGITNLTLSWKYKVVGGSGVWISMGDSGPHKIFRVYGTPQFDPPEDQSLYTETNLDTCVGWADGCEVVNTSDDPNNIPRKVQSGVKAWHTQYGYRVGVGFKSDPFTYIPVNQGDCLTYADLMTEGLRVLGIGASTRKILCWNGTTSHWFFTQGQTPHYRTTWGDADGDSTINSSESGYPDTIDGVYINAIGSSSVDDPWNFHGASDCAGHWWEITFNSSPDHGTQTDMCSHPNGPVIYRQGPLFGGSL
ncbi:MAG: hypothetical protein J7M40_03055, partial [Planctomycetes bacterium]|nr:hypothetical protein [Planctomycetota bacterium]